MSANVNDQPRILGNTSGLPATDVVVADWSPPLPQALDPVPLPPPPPRPLLASPRRAGSASAAGGASSPTVSSPRPSHVPSDSLRGRVWAQAEDAGRILQDMVLSVCDPSVKVDAGTLLVSLGEDVASEVMKKLNYWAVVEATTAVASIREVDAEDEQRVLAAFDEHLQARQWVRHGGREYARRLLERAVGRSKATSILEASVEEEPRFHLLRQLPPRDVAPFITHEHPQTVALILSQLDPTQAAATLDQLAEDLQKDVAYRIATLENVTPAVLKSMEEGVEAMLRDILGGEQDVGGPKVLADMLNLTRSTTEQVVLDALDAGDATLGERVRNVMFTFEDIGNLAGKDLAVLVEAFPQDEWAMALKAAEEPLKERVRGVMGEERWDELRERMEFLGPMRLRDVEALQIRMVHRVRELETAGELTIVRGMPDPYV
ncbi:MAG: flagellar motor switch protein FliG [Gemmatimonadetes bacterium]|jgi:flagellar motor switch protein FliG|nr:flagellar motor switch protein FliG [Gemmatimonadota bacterium]MBT6149306.1 flagellar motor switch protein FliG [Gemmatimonadota bacterium]MBT7861133.1 flagellar motor switch protein FliG [Gemmatimonadota bacterium]